MGDIVLPLTDRRASHAATAGGKGASLSRMIAAGLPVPGGFVVSSGAFRGFLEQCGGIRLIADATRGLHVEDDAALKAAAERIRTAIMTAPLPDDLSLAVRAAYDALAAPLVAVRSSAVSEDGETASFAGQQDTYLNVASCADVLHRLRDCWASFFSPRALFYRGQKADLADTRMAVVVQEMVQAETSGVMFTVDPIRHRLDCMIIEAAPGLGEAVVSGEVTPDHYVLDREHGTLIDEFLPDPDRPRALDTDQLQHLRQLGLRLDAFFGAPQDVEWCLRANALYLLQSRPITTLAHHG